MMRLLLALLLPSCTLAKTVMITVRENFTQSCPNVKSDIIDRSSVKFSFEMIPNEDDENEDDEVERDQVILTDLNGQSRSISFPGCYRVKLSFKMNRPIENPYIEAFLQLGQNIPCRSEGRTLVSNICTNITKTNWCPQSGNEELRRMLANKESW
ncbi:unnamed protein product [Cylicostephanus goldi]|uniref:MD-2-related lipid-recognition domain-containing protein n=1 Tax=Cylicostephanus goldi TaxID=71465 RepID=A0A3P6RPJ0_CYLGO|nr:unnamed protein product [Cylicostephanus goldi]